ncbi:hypothetical protein PU629_14240 [Pullulanibacillus sp. KACC 23026]|uniref:hypothetical protein n=1 Tax=Pullulanibacillus sp. KACC 23026 TaxID=3028315 RepID=UPI0023AFD9F8|nr:hypothetical protein [Pullulanibacillus sp. KACC 23026]WEG11320.1 hypothetical protein PU629_14240 [Pullulanibacillus sp. KACC 23026]
MNRLAFVKMGISVLLGICFWLPQTTSFAKGQANEMKQLQLIEQATQQKNWSEANSRTHALKKYCEARLWKYQLLSNQNEYNPMLSDLSKLNGAVKAHDKAQTLVWISAIKSQVKLIYSP